MNNRFASLILSAMLIVLSGNIMAQQADTLVVISEINVTENRLENFNAGSTVYQPSNHLMTAPTTMELGDVLQLMSPMNVESYGVGSAGISARGAGNERTPILWNGFNLQSIANGEIDLSLFPMLFSDNLKMEMGGNSALFGSGAVGGVIYLDNTPSYNQPKRTFLNLSAGSFGRFNGASGIQFGNKNYSGVLRTYYQQADNDFDFNGDYVSSTGATHVEGSMSNAEMHQFGVMMNNHFRLNNGQNLSINLWYQDVNRNIAPTIRDMARGNSSDANQIDVNTRTTAEWNVPFEKGVFRLRSGLFISETDYTKPSSSDSTNTKGISSINEAELDWHFTQWLKWNIGANYTYEQAKSTSYEEKNNRNRYAAFTSFAFNSQSTGSFITLNGRGEKAGEGDFTLTGNVGLTQQLFHGLALKGKVGTSYRVPTFNDLYWYGGYAVGNTDLQAETGFNWEAGLHYDRSFSSTQLNFQATYYNNQMENWISWGAREDGIYTVFNQDEAEISGVELHGSIQQTIKNSVIGLNVFFTKQDAKDPNADEWLPYVPEEKVAASLFGEYKGFSLIYSHSYVGKRFTSSTPDWLPSYNLGNLSVEKRLAGEIETLVTLKVKNVWDENYQTRLNYPMTGRQFLLSLQLSLF